MVLNAVEVVVVACSVVYFTYVRQEIERKVKLPCRAHKIAATGVVRIQNVVCTDCSLHPLISFVGTALVSRLRAAADQCVKNVAVLQLINSTSTVTLQNV